MKIELPKDIVSSVKHDDIIGEGLFRFLEDIEWSSEEEEDEELNWLYRNIEYKADKKAAKNYYKYKYSFESSTSELLHKELDAMSKEKKLFNKIYGIPTVQELQANFNSDSSLAKWLITEFPGVLKVPNQCPCCGHTLKLQDTKVRCYHCAKHGTRKFKQSVWKNSFFDDIKKDRSTVMMFLYYWLGGATTKQLGVYTGWSKTTVNRLLVKAQELITKIAVHDHQLIGGPGIAVEIDESKFGKRKCNKGHRVEGCWVFGGVELTPERRCFAIVVPDRSTETLLPIIASHIAPGSIIRSNFWKAHDIIPFIPGHDYVHEKVNHSKEFVSDDGVHTNTIEGTWSGIKRVTPVKQRTKKGSPVACLTLFGEEETRGTYGMD